MTGINKGARAKRRSVGSTLSIRFRFSAYLHMHVRSGNHETLPVDGFIYRHGAMPPFECVAGPVGCPTPPK